MKIKALILFLSLLILPACARLEPGADSLVVRVEQTEAIALSTFDLVLNVDNANRAFYRTNAPGFHVFAEYLRAPVTIGSDTLPRGLSMVKSLHDIKNAYKLNRTKEKKANLTTALVTMNATLDQATAWLGTVTTNTSTIR